MKGDHRTATLVCMLLMLLAAPVMAHPVLNEMMSSNTITIQDEDGTYSDWVELYNPGPAAIDLQGYSLSTNAANLTMWTFPSKTLAPGEFLLVWCSSKNRVNASAPLHTTFKISKSGVPIYLTAPDNVTNVSTIPSTALGDDKTVGYLPDGTAPYKLLALPTPGISNALGVPPLAINLSRAPGFVNGAFNLTITANRAGATIHYTLDGSVPNATSPIYTGPILVTNRTGVPNDLSMIMNTSPKWTAPNGEVQKATIVRAIAYEGNDTSPVKTATYLVDASFTVPVISVTTDRANLFDYEDGIYLKGKVWDDAEAAGWQGTPTFHPANYREDWERPVHLEMFETNGTRVVDQDVGMQISGQGSRARQQKSMRFYARSEYGKSSIAYPLFPDLTITSYKRATVRNPDDDERTTFIRDALAAEMVQGTGLAMEDYRPVVVFLDGEYWGLYPLREKANQHYLESHYGVNKDDVVILEDNALIDEGLPGDEVPYLDLVEFVRTHDMRDPANYAYAQTQMDTESFARYYALETFVANTDWPSRNVVLWRLKTGALNATQYGFDGRWRWILHDTDYAFGYQSWQGADYDMFKHIEQTTWGGRLWRGLARNEQFRNDFATITADQLRTNFAPDAIISLIDSIGAGLAPEVPQQILRWTTFDSVNTWEQNLDILRQFAVDRQAYHRAHLAKYFGLGGNVDLTVTGDDSRGNVTVNTLAIATPSTGTYFQDIPITINATPLPGKQFLGWTGGASGDDPSITVVLEQDTVIGAVFADAPGPAPAGAAAWVTRKYPATFISIAEGTNVTLALEIANPAGVPLAETWMVDGAPVASGALAYAYVAQGVGNHTINVTVTGADVSISRHWIVTVKQATGEVCYTRLADIPSRCIGGTITQDTNAGAGRDITCTNGSSSMRITVWAHPNEQNPQDFEMWAQSRTGTQVTGICLGTVCITNNGFERANFPFCIETVTQRDISFATTAPAGTSVMVPLGSTQRFNYTLNNPAGLPVGSLWTIDGEIIPFQEDLAWYDYVTSSVGTFNLTVNVSSNETRIQRSWSVIVTANGTGNQTNTTTNTTGTCYASAKTLPVNCTATITNDTVGSNGCRAITCAIDASNRLSIEACNKPGDYQPAYFEIYRQGSSVGTSPTICLGTVCIRNEGYRRSPDFPICIGTTNVTQNISFSSTTPPGAAITVAEPASQQFAYVLSNPSGLPTAASWLVNGTNQTSAFNGTAYTFNGLNGTYNITVRVTSPLNAIARTWILTVLPNSTVLQNISFATLTPAASSVTVAEPSSQAFSYTLSNPSGLPTTTTWMIDGITQGNTGTAYTFTGNYSSAGTYNVTARVTSPQNTISNSWTLTVTDTPPPNASVTLSIAPWFPQGRNYVFVCQATGFTPTSYEYYFGDGEKLLGHTQNNIWHTYAAAGNYAVNCTAADATNRASSSLAITVV